MIVIVVSARGLIVLACMIVVTCVIIMSACGLVVLACVLVVSARGVSENPSADNQTL